MSPRAFGRRLRYRICAGVRHRPCSLRRGGAVVLPRCRGARPFSLVTVRERSAERRIRSIVPRSSSERGRLSALHLRRSHRGDRHRETGPGAALPGADGARAPRIQAAFAVLRPRRVQPFKAAGHSAGGRRPRPPGSKATLPRPRAPHPAPSSKRLATTPSTSRMSGLYSHLYT